MAGESLAFKGLVPDERNRFGVLASPQVGSPARPTSGKGSQAWPPTAKRHYKRPRRFNRVAN